MNVTYRLDCTTCIPNTEHDNTRNIYLGCTGRNLHIRLIEHSKDKNSQDKKNAMSKHMAAIHPDVPVIQHGVTANIVARHRSTLSRLVDESLRLEKETNLANSKGEFGRGGGLVRMHAAKTQQDILNLDPGG